jgi:hypothetical protein
MITKKFTLLVFSILLLNLHAQQKNRSCNFKKLATLITKVEGTNSKSDIDKLFGVEGKLTSDPNSPDSLVKTYNYQMCDDKLEHTYMVAFLKDKLVYVVKSFASNSKCGKEEDFEKTLNKNYTYDDVKNKFGMDGDIRMISWDPQTSKQERIEYIWRCCNKTTYYTIVFKNGELLSSGRFPQKQDYSRPSNGKK